MNATNFPTAGFFSLASERMDGDDEDCDGVLNKDDNCPYDSQIGNTDFRGVQSIDLCVGNCFQTAPTWVFHDEGKEIWQEVNSGPGIAIGETRLSAMDFSGTIFVDTFYKCTSII